MANALELPPAQQILKAHPLLKFSRDGYSYTIERKGDVSMYTVRGEGGEISLPIQYAMGVHNQTYVLQYRGRFYEGRVSYFEKSGGLALTMGQERSQPTSLTEALGRVNSAEEITVCFGCHSTNSVTQGKLSLDSVKPGVTCEHCHAGAAEHMQAITHGKTSPMPGKLGDMAAEDMSHFCGQCHRTWEFVVRKRAFGEANVRFAPYRLANSDCFLGDDKRIRCTACHDPHGTLARDAAGYDRACTACHTAPEHKTCPVAKNDCASCHMPKVARSDGHVSFTDHQIRVVHPGDPYPN